MDKAWIKKSKSEKSERIKRCFTNRWHQIPGLRGLLSRSMAIICFSTFSRAAPTASPSHCSTGWLWLFWVAWYYITTDVRQTYHFTLNFKLSWWPGPQNEEELRWECSFTMIKKADKVATQFLNGRLQEITVFLNLLKTMWLWKRIQMPWGGYYHYE